MKERLQAWSNTKVIEIASCFVFNENNQLLLLQRHAEDLGGGQWGTPGGRLEKGEEPRAAALRELWEETGIKTTNAMFLGVHNIAMPHGTVAMTSYKISIPSTTSITIDPEEHHAYAWYDTETLCSTENILWGMPTILRDFSLIGDFSIDPTLTDGSKVALVRLGDG
jgi:mutator protein MutT